MFLRHGMLAAVACASGPLMALGSRSRPIGSDEEGSLGKNFSSHSGSDNWQDHATALDRLGRDAFSGAVGTNFKVFPSAGESAPVWVTLFSVNDLPAPVPANSASFAVPNKGASFALATTGFVLVFGGSSPLSQGTHLFEHQEMGRFAMFTVPEGNGQQTHAAVINRLQGAPVVAIPYRKAMQTEGNPATGAITLPAATSSVDEGLSHGLSESQGSRRAAERD